MNNTEIASWWLEVDWKLIQFGKNGTKAIAAN